MERLKVEAKWLSKSNRQEEKEKQQVDRNADW